MYFSPIVNNYIANKWLEPKIKIKGMDIVKKNINSDSKTYFRWNLNKQK